VIGEILSAQVGQKAPHRPEGGDSAAARDLGITRQEIQRAEAIAGIEPEAKEAVVAAGLDSNQSVLLKIASAPKQEQVKAVEGIRAKRGRPGKDANLHVSRSDGSAAGCAAIRRGFARRGSLYWRVELLIV
jgi:hypothetical protein